MAWYWSRVARERRLSFSARNSEISACRSGQRQAYPAVGTNPVVITPAEQDFVLTTFAPTAVIGTVITPDAATLVLTTFAPTVSTPVVVTPANAALVLTTFAPTVSTPVTVTPGVMALVLTTFAPTLTNSTPVVATSGSTGGAYYPQYPVRIAKPRVIPQTQLEPVLVVPATLQLVLKGYAPTVWITTTLVTFAPYIEVTKYLSTDEIFSLWTGSYIGTQEALSLMGMARKTEWSGANTRLLELALVGS
jgi:hypothetical protein